MWPTRMRRQGGRLESQDSSLEVLNGAEVVLKSQDSSLEVLNGAEVVLKWQLCTILHLAGRR